VYVARIFLWESCNFGEKKSVTDNEFFLRDCFLLAHWYICNVGLLQLLSLFCIQHLSIQRQCLKKSRTFLTVTQKMLDAIKHAAALLF